MLPVNYGGHAACQDTFVSAFLELFPDPFAVPKQTWDIIVKFWYLNLSETDTIMQEFYFLLGVFPMLERASRHDMLSFLYTFFAMKS